MRGDPLVLCRQGRPPGPRRVDRAPSPACICLGPRAPVVEWAVIRPSAREPDLGPGSRRPTPAALGLTLALSVCKPPSGRRRVRGEPPPPRGPHSMSRVCRDPYCLLPARGPPGGGPARDASRLVWRLPRLSPSVLAQRVCVSPSRVHVIDVSPVVQWGLPGSGLGGLPAGWWFGCRLAGPLARKSLTALCRGQGPLPLNAQKMPAVQEAHSPRAGRLPWNRRGGALPDHTLPAPGWRWRRGPSLRSVGSPSRPQQPGPRGRAPRQQGPRRGVSHPVAGELPVQRKEGTLSQARALPLRHNAERKTPRWRGSGQWSLESGGTASGVLGPGAPEHTSLTHSLPRQADPDSLSLQRSWDSTPPTPCSEIPSGLSRLDHPLDRGVDARGTGSSLGSPYPLNPLQSKAKAKASWHEPLFLPTAPSRRGPACGPQEPHGCHWAGREGCRQEEQLRLGLAQRRGHVRPGPAQPRAPSGPRTARGQV